MNLRSNLIQIYSMPVSTKMRNDVHITESISAFDHINRAANINNFNLVRLISVFLGHRTRRIRIDIDIQHESLGAILRSFFKQKLCQQNPVIDAQRLLKDIIQRALERSEEHTSELQSIMRISYAVFCLNKKTKTN